MNTPELVGDEIMQIEATCKSDTYPSFKNSKGALEGCYSTADRYNDLYELFLLAYNRHPDWFENNKWLRKFAQATYMGILYHRCCDRDLYKRWFKNKDNALLWKMADTVDRNNPYHPCGQDPFYVLMETQFNYIMNDESKFWEVTWNTYMCIVQNISPLKYVVIER